MKLVNFGMMRGGQHVYILWIIGNFSKNEVLYYNNVRKINYLEDRIVKKNDTRILDLADKLVENVFETKKIEIYSFESQILTQELIEQIKEYIVCKTKFTVVLRNPYNNFASLLKYVENGGESVYVKNIIENLEEFKKIWISLADFIIEGNVIPVFYEKFIEDKDYRIKLSKKIGVNITNNFLIKSKFGGGSSFLENHDYNNRYKNYIDHPKMMTIMKDKEIEEKWRKINLFGYKFEKED